MNLHSSISALGYGCPFTGSTSSGVGVLDFPVMCLVRRCDVGMETLVNNPLNKGVTFKVKDIIIKLVLRWGLANDT